MGKYVFSIPKQAWVLLILCFMGNKIHAQRPAFFLNPNCLSCSFIGTLLHYNDTTTKKCVETCVFLGILYQSPTLKCGKCPTGTPPPPPPPPPPPIGNFTIELGIDPTIASANQPALLAAKARWEGIITGDLVNYTVTQSDVTKSTCILKVGQVIDDIYVCANARTIDGRGGVVITATPEIWPQTGPDQLPTISYIAFDIDDIASLQSNGQLATVAVSRNSIAKLYSLG